MNAQDYSVVESGKTSSLASLADVHHDVCASPGLSLIMTRHSDIVFWQQRYGLDFMLSWWHAGAADQARHMEGHLELRPRAG